MPYPSSVILADAAADLAGSHPLTIVTIPALLRARKSDADPVLDMGLPTIKAFGTRHERPVLEAFRLRKEGNLKEKNPYLAVWQDSPTFIRNDYPGSTLQRLRTQDLLGQELFDIAWNDDHSKRIGTALRPTAGRALADNRVKPVNRLSLALWLGRDENLPQLESYLDWFDKQYPLHSTDLEEFYRKDFPEYAQAYTKVNETEWAASQPASNEEILAMIGLFKKMPSADLDDMILDVPSTTPPKLVTGWSETAQIDTQVDDLRWTRDFCAYYLRDANIARIVQKVLTQLEAKRIILPDADTLVTRCVATLLVGHLILQGPPGTGKTTLARILADAFDVILLESTATSEWSPFHVVGGLRPSRDNRFEPSYGKVADAALKCALCVREDVNAEADGGDDVSTSQARRVQGAWLLIDEFNRADIDKAIGSLYTMLSSCDAANLDRSPIDLWFETEGRQQLWVPSRFRIIAAMNDLDTSFVNPISQGLVRRFQFITIGVPRAAQGTTGIYPETQSSLGIAYDWLSSTYGSVITLNPLNAVVNQLEVQIALAQELIERLRVTVDGTAGWPVGTAQLVDIFRVLLLQTVNGMDATQALDWAVTDRLVPQMSHLDETQLSRAEELFELVQLPQARR
ncbi:MAG TPA: AAA family ATPase, partial [Actinophytocola sp.]|uniref:AAA family ATPase n=1 Tax=Actinophytocola sp. TaxID=1872138 RepID=UPI002E077595|nr:AAA family ATPase [Actinophytocola sp.]